MTVTSAALRRAAILVADGNPANIALLDSMLRDDGFSDITGTTDPAHVVDLCAERDYDLVLLDIAVPGLDGLEVMRHLDQRIEGNLPVIVLTSRNDQDTRHRALAAGARDFLSKPFDRLEVLHRIHNTLEARLFYRLQKEQSATLEREIAARTFDLLRMARQDPITGLPNRRALREDLAAGLRTGAGALLFLSVHGITRVSDALGYHKGEALLRACGHRLAGMLPPEATIGAWGGNQFAVIGPGCDAGTLSGAVMEAFARPFEVEDADLLLDCTIGSCRFPADGTDPDRLVQRAALALYHGRHNGHGHRPFSRAMESEANHRLALERDLRLAVRNHAFALHYQPKVSLHDGHVVGVEALVRWTHPDRGVVSPDSFVPLAEETGAIIGLGDWVLESACAELAALRAEGHGDNLTLAVNVSPRQFSEPGLVGRLRQVLAASGLPGSALEVEITESVLIADLDRVRDVLRAIRALGCAIAVDDFGTGYSSLAYLRQLPITTLKIDRSFVISLDQGEDEQAIVRAILALAHSLGLCVVAEGVETQHHVSWLASLGCDAGQGYFFARPLAADALRSWLSSYSAKGAWT